MPSPRPAIAWLSIDRLATAWGDDPPASVRNQVMIAVAVLRRALGDPARSARCAGQALAVHRETGFRLGEERARALCEVALR